MSAEAQSVQLTFEHIVLDRDSAGNWLCQGEHLSIDADFQTILNTYGKNGFQLVCYTRERAILTRMRPVVVSKDAEEAKTRQNQARAPIGEGPSAVTPQPI